MEDIKNIVDIVSVASLHHQKMHVKARYTLKINIRGDRLNQDVSKIISDTEIEKGYIKIDKKEISEELSISIERNCGKIEVEIKSTDNIGEDYLCFHGEDSNTIKNKIETACNKLFTPYLDWVNINMRGEPIQSIIDIKMIKVDE